MLKDYQQSLNLNQENYPFYSLMMAAALRIENSAKSIAIFQLCVPFGYDAYTRKEALKISPEYSVNAILMEAIRQADSFNTLFLQRQFPALYKEMKERYNAPGGILETDKK